MELLNTQEWWYGSYAFDSDDSNRFGATCKALISQAISKRKGHFLDCGARSGEASGVQMYLHLRNGLFTALYWTIKILMAS